MRVPPLFSFLILSRVYVVGALATAAVLSPLVYLPIPLFTLLLYLYAEVAGGRERLKVPLHLFLALSLPLLYRPWVGMWASPVFALPVIPLLDHSLRRFSGSYRFGPTGDGQRPTNLCLLLGLSLGAVGLLAAALGSWGLVLSASAVAVYLGAAVTHAWRRLARVPVEAEVVSQRVLVGELIRVVVRLRNRSNLGGHLSLHGSDTWLQVRPARLIVDRPAVEVEALFTPPLAGPTTVVVGASFLDPWGLTRADFTLEIMKLFIVPRARYAEWLARKYLEMSGPGGQESPAAVGTGARRGSRRGVEFYGLRQYQAGDSARNIDWKHSLKLHQMIVKEFADTGVQFAVVTVNLAVAGEEEKDKLAYGLINTALTLAGENIPSVLTAYDHRRVVAITPLLDPRQALLQALRLAREVTICPVPLRYLGVLDVARLRGNIYRLRQSGDEAAVKLAQLLEVEYLALRRATRDSPATAALNAALRVAGAGAMVLIISGHNHDAEAIALSRYDLGQKGYRVLEIELNGTGRAVPRAEVLQPAPLT